MIKDFEEVKKQLAELVDIINGFKSEQVQLRILDALLPKLSSSGQGEEGDNNTEQDTEPSTRKRTRKVKVGNSKSESNGSKKSGKKGPKAAVMELIGSGFFGKKRSAAEVQNELRDKKAMTASVPSIQTTMNRLLSSGEIQRERDDETKQFRYWR